MKKNTVHQMENVVLKYLKILTSKMKFNSTRVILILKYKAKIFFFSELFVT